MSQEGPQLVGSQIEKTEKIETGIITFNDCHTVEEMIERVQEIKKENDVDLVMLGEYTFTVTDILDQLETITNLAKETKVDILLAPDNEYSAGASWGDTKTQFTERGAEVEVTDMPNDHKPQTIGVFVYKSGKVFVFPKTWHLNPVHKPLHIIPGTNIAVTICGEIGQITPDDLEKLNGIKIIYNPSREGDDSYLKFRMLQKYGGKPLTREEISDILKQEDYYKSLLDDAQYDKNAAYPDYIEEHDSREAREKKFNDAVEEHYQKSVSSEDSLYTGKISVKLKEKGISIVRCDGDRCSGVLNQTTDTAVQGVAYNEGHAVFKVLV